MAKSAWGMTPKESIEAECHRRGRENLVSGCIDLLLSQGADPDLIVALGGPSASWAVTGGAGGPDYWLRVWAARGLNYAWDDSATSALSTAMSDPAWRVREMALKVVARHRLVDLRPEVSDLLDDPVPRVRAAAERATARIESADTASR